MAVEGPKTVKHEIATTLPHATGTRLGTRLGMIFFLLLDLQCRGNYKSIE